MNSVWEAAAVAGWAILLVNLALTLRLVHWLGSFRESERLRDLRADMAELSVGEPAPPFRAPDLSGQMVTSEDFAGREVALVFVSARCGTCRRELPGLMRLAALAERSAGTEIILVTGDGAGEAASWVEDLRAHDKLELTTRLLWVPQRTSLVYSRFNPRMLTPYFCLIDRSGNVAARGGLGSQAWTAAVRTWESADSPARSLRRYV